MSDIEFENECLYWQNMEWNYVFANKTKGFTMVFCHLCGLQLCIVLFVREVIWDIIKENLEPLLFSIKAEQYQQFFFLPNHSAKW